MNFCEMAENIGLDEQDFREMVELFISVGMADIRKMQDAFLSGDCQGVMMSAHSIKGAAANLGFDEIRDIAKGIESDARAKKLDGLDGGIARIEQEFGSVSAALEGR